MTQSEAIQKIESWLLVPVDYETIVPALAFIRETPDYHYYLKRVAEAEYASPNEIENSIVQYLAANPVQNPYSSLNDKLSQISGRSNRRIDEELNAQPVDILDELDAKRRRKYEGSTEEEKLGDAYEAFVSGYVAGKNSQSTLPALRCHRCNAVLTTREIYHLSTMHKVLAIILFFVFPLLPILVYFGCRQKKVQVYCPICGKIHS